MLQIKNVGVNYGPIQALHAINVEINAGEIVSLLGANGAGKTSLLRAISGLTPLNSGSISWNGQDISNIPSYQIISRGITHCPEGRRIFSALTVLENLDMGAYILNDEKQKADNLDYVLTLFPRLKERIQQKGGTLSGGEQQMLAVARALMSRPQLLMLDEPSLGLAPLIVRQIFEIIAKINKEEQIMVFLIEQNAHEALKHSHKAYVLENGKITMQGASKDLLTNDQIISAYLG